MKKLLTILLVLGMLVCLAACGEEVGQYQTFTSGDFTYELVGEEATIISYTGVNPALVIPATLDGYPVVKLGSALFRNNIGIVTVAVEGTSLREVGSAAFAGCTMLTTVTLPNSVTVIGNGAFMGCTALSTFVAPTGLETIGSNAFASCSALTAFAMGEDVLSIGKGAFENCTALASVTFSANLTTIGENAFAGCSVLSGITFGDKLETIGNNAFANCTALSQITLPKGLTEMGNTVFAGCTALSQITFNAVGYQDADATDTSLQSIGSSSLALTIGPDVLRIPAFAFFNVPLTSVEFAPNSTCTLICNSAFKSCRQLTSLNIPDSVTTIETNAFSGCSGLTSLSLPFVGANRDVVQSGATDAMFGYIFGTANDSQCTATKQYYVGKSTDKSGALFVTYYIPKNLAKVTIRGGAIGYNAFDGCTMINDLTIGDAVISVVAGSLHSTAWFAAKADNSVVYANSKVLYGYKSVEEGATPITALNVTEGVVSISADAFKDCTTLQTITLPASLTDIGADAFVGCTALTDITVAEGNTAFQSVDGVLYNKEQTELMIYPANKNATSFTIPETVTSVWESAFANNGKLATLTIPASVTEIKDQAIVGCTALTAITVADENENYASVDGVLFNKAETQLIVYPAAAVAESYAIPADVIGVSANAFNGALNLKTVTIGSKVTIIGANAFKGCTHTVLYSALPSAPSEENWKKGWSGDSPVYYNVKEGFLLNVDGMQFLVTANVSGATTTYTAQLTKYVGTAASVTIPATVQFTPAGADAAIAVDVVKISKRAFSNTPAATITFAAGADITDFGNSAFVDSAFWNAQADGIVYLNNMVIGFKGEMAENYIAEIKNGTTAICYKAFYDMKNLVGVVIPDSLTMIADSAFGNTGLKSVYTYKTSDTHAQIEVTSGGNTLYKNAKVYYFSATAPTTEGNFWHIVENVPTAWPAYEAPAE